MNSSTVAESVPFGVSIRFFNNLDFIVTSYRSIESRCIFTDNQIVLLYCQELIGLTTAVCRGKQTGQSLVGNDNRLLPSSISFRSAHNKTHSS